MEYNLIMEQLVMELGSFRNVNRENNEHLAINRNSLKFWWKRECERSTFQTKSTL